MLDKDQPLSVDGDELQIRFHYVPTGKKTQDALNEEAVKTVFEQTAFKDWLVLLQAKAPTEKNKDRTLLEKHLNDYTARHTFDYFIHKDLGGFLRRELDFYIKNEVLYLDDIDDAAFAVTEQHLRKIKVIRAIALKLIRMLAQLEDFQKKLWLKKKFVVETQYCITLDRVPEALYPEIAANQVQHDEWVKLFAINGIKKDLENLGYTKPLTVDFLKANNKLVLDTRFFDEGFKDRLLASIEGFDEQCDGLLIHSENFQALNLLQERYLEQVNCIYIDPPYNTDAGPISYKNGYRSSSWISLIKNRISASKNLLENVTGILCATIDDYQQKELHYLVEEQFGKDNLAGTIAIRVNPSGRPVPSGFAQSHEYAIFATANSSATIGLLPRTDSQMARYRESDKDGPYMWELFRKRGSNSERKDRPSLYYPIYLTDTHQLRIPQMTWDTDLRNWQVHEEPQASEEILYPIDDNGVERTWRGKPETMMNDSAKFCVKKKDERWIVYYKFRPNQDGVLPLTLWSDAKYSATEHGTGTIKNIFSEYNVFSYPKSIYAVQDCISIAGMRIWNSLCLDYFAGSGTTGHAVINLNREDNGKRKYILVEMGNYFDTVLKPRIAKVVYSDSWKDGKPTARNSGISHCFKYLRLESYEDALNNLILKNRTKPQQNLLNENPALREDYLLGYWLDVETADSPSLLNIDQFEDPFNYRLNIATGSVGAFKPTRVDLVETFNYLIGLRVKHTDTLRGFKIVIGANPKGESVLIVWRNLKEKDNAALEAFLDKQKYNPRDTEFDHLYVNGDHTLDDPHSKVKMIESEFKRLMFDVQGV